MLIRGRFALPKLANKLSTQNAELTTQVSSLKDTVSQLAATVEQIQARLDRMEKNSAQVRSYEVPIFVFATGMTMHTGTDYNTYDHRHVAYRSQVG